jgi:hypothetical protein
VEAGSREENASNQESGARSDPIGTRLQSINEQLTRSFGKVSAVHIDIIETSRTERFSSPAE